MSTAGDIVVSMSFDAVVRSPGRGYKRRSTSGRPRRAMTVDKVVSQRWGIAPPNMQPVVRETVGEWHDVDDAPANEPVEYAAELAWLDEHGAELAAYPAEWVALSLAHGGVVAHDPSLRVVMTRAREQGVERPFLIPVPPAGAIVL